MPISAFDHYTIRARDVDVSARFYEEIMGFRAQILDGFEFPFRLLFLGDQAIVHLMGVGPALDAFLGRQAPSYATRPERITGNMEHVAFNATGMADFMSRLQARSIQFIERSLPDYGVAQLMLDDPDGIEIEVNFPLAEKQALAKVINTAP
jgi:catechol 2,3-dioxygenase-like lactoylglutathione lyase family enzyme